MALDSYTRTKLWAEGSVRGDDGEDEEIYGASFATSRHTQGSEGEVILEGRYLCAGDHIDVEGTWSGSPQEISDGIALLTKSIKDWFDVTYPVQG